MASHHSLLSTITVLTILFCHSSLGRNLVLTETNAKMPSGRMDVGSIYDGDDSIYIIGGHNSYSTPDILKYSLFTDEIQLVGTFPIRNTYSSNNALALNSEGKIFSFQTVGFNMVIMEFDPLKRESRIVGNYTNMHFSQSPLIQHKPDKVLIMGNSNSAFPGDAVSIDLITFQIEQYRGVIPQDFRWFTGVWNAEKGETWAIGTAANNSLFPIRFNPESLECELEAEIVGGPVLQNAFWYSVFANGTLFLTDPSATEEAWRAGVSGINLQTMEFSFRPVDNMIPTRYRQSVYVEKLNRIFLIGGTRGAQYQYQNSVWYLDLNLLGKEVNSNFS